VAVTVRKFASLINYAFPIPKILQLIHVTARLVLVFMEP